MVLDASKMRGIARTFLFSATLFMVASVSLANKASNNTTGVLLDQVSEAGNGNNTVVRTVRRAEAVSIPGTLLKTHTYYKLSMKKHPSGVFTYTAAARGDYNYVQIDYNADDAKSYFANGVWYPDAQWEFIPVSYCGKSGWYRMRNRAKPNQYLTWSTGELIYPDTGAGLFLIVDANKEKTVSNNDFLVKPERVYDGSKPLDYYQLKFKGLPKGVVTWSQKEYKTDSKYMMVDITREPGYLKEYKKGGQFYDDTLFSFEMPVVDRDDDPSEADTWTE